MANDWTIARSEYIARYFPSDKLMRDIAEKAFNGDPFFQEELAEWFASQGMLAEAESWRSKARYNRETLGQKIDEE